MTVFNVFRAMTLAPKHTIIDTNGVLDISSITNRVLVAAGPSDDTFSNTFRCSIENVVEYLEKITPSRDSWCIWNLRGEGIGYNSKALGTKLVYRPIPDHQPPLMELMRSVVAEIDSFLEESPDNLALIHCKEGKGRSGTICCAYLMFEAKRRGIVMDEVEAMRIFTRKRMRDHFGPGVSIRSQVRYLSYWKEYLSLPDKALRDYKYFQDSKRAAFDPHASCITKVTVVNPTPILLATKLKLSTYASTNGGVVPREIFRHSVKLPSVGLSSKYTEILVGIPISASNTDLRISFERHICVTFAWMNLYFETPGHNNRQHLALSGIQPGRMVLEWEQFDGFRGLKCSKFAKLFDRIEINWVFHARRK